MAELVYEKLSYQLNGIAFSIFKELGSGLKEKTYGDAFEMCLQEAGIPYKREIHYPTIFEGRKINGQYFDFLIDDKIIVELKCGDREYYQAFDQLKNYLELSDLKLGLIIRFAKDGVRVRRIVNIKS